MLVEAGLRHTVDPLLLAAIMDRESRGGEALIPSGPTGTGDHGFGLGLMQIDRRFHADFVAKKSGHGVPLWSIPQWNINYAAGLLADDLHAFGGEEIQAVAAYNAGRARVKQVSLRVPRPYDKAILLAMVDTVTTNKYAAWVLKRRQDFATPPPPLRVV
jgi:soluble lytic murein transglycosylase-like protein